MHALLIVNPNATSTTAAGRDLLAHALASRVRLTVTHTTHRGHASELARRAREDATGLIIVHGGDGTVNEVVNGLLGVPHPTRLTDLPVGPIPPIAVVPGGSANVFARSLGISPDPVEATNQVIDLIGHRTSRRIGLAHCDERWFTFNAGLGLDAQVCEAVEAHRSAGKLATPGQYLRATVRAFFAAKGAEPSLTAEVPGHEPVEGVHFAFVSNTSPWTYLNARPIHTNPGTTYDGGLGLFAMRSTRLGTTLRVARQLLAPGASPHSKSLLRVDDAARIRLTSSRPIGLQMDGDYIGLRDRVEFVSVPDALDVVAPPAR
ncbi:diacylglycerol kinase family lipid kinase [Rhodococcus triatomae]|uniref:Diacylglycerol kinase family enzyme n=1 Tax=Rhodococcus triatomae TaxID=300028 RepID=A0A1G8F7Z4_9NOCA|nr:diacylglycerol kinase family protein [Rhodococcus triatomae]QNG19412.1 diacylglycerol kinase family lipid kinase [Rhodococcus triatomae]QNG24675.1 diacylglycerol kinase family lipid kinase [Rhodococcus triatomae]SDH78185.1 Diacylglycerol kinase family enzyme [Rhodococcus triatomae]